MSTCIHYAATCMQLIRIFSAINERIVGYTLGCLGWLTDRIRRPCVTSL